MTEISFKAIVLGVILAIILAAANAYLGLFAGMTVSASIPAAVISMAVLRLFRNHTILENNIVQTAASAGEALAAGVIFTLPALVMMGYWQAFDYWETTLIALSGGILGVLFTIPLRQALIVRQQLQFPEGFATAQVLTSGEQGGKAVVFLIKAALWGGLIKFFQQGLQLWGSVWEKARIVGTKGYAYLGFDISPALLAVGYIVGFNVSLVIFLGGAISWWIAIPTMVWMEGIPDGMSALDAGYALWSAKIRYIGVGAMLVGGVSALFALRESITSAIKEGIASMGNSAIDTAAIPRTERDTPMKYVLWGILIMLFPIFAIYLANIESIGISLIMTLVMVVAGFLFSAVAGYMAGLVGSSNNPISGITIATVLTASLILVALMGNSTLSGAAAAILIGGVVCCAAAIAGDNLQDLKAGYVVGATPWKQQVMLIVGVVASALVMAPVLTLLNTAYGFGARTPEHPDALTAPQAGLMQSVAEGVFGGNLPWDMIYIGMGIGLVVLALDYYLEKRKSSFSMPVLALAIGIYLPFELGSTILIGGGIAALVQRIIGKEEESRSGLLFSAGLITGEALMGIILAIPIALYAGENMFDLGINLSDYLGFDPSILVLVFLSWVLYRAAVRRER